jgi:large subunit ribosomal protein L3
MGNVKCTASGLKIVDVRPEQNLILVKGAVPGPNNRHVTVMSAAKSKVEHSWIAQ